MLYFILGFVIIVLCIQFIYQYKNKLMGDLFQDSIKESMKPRDESKKRGLICYYGGSFRDGPTGNANQDTERGFDSQFYSTQSHIKLTSLMKEKGYDVDTIINTYHSTFENNLSKCNLIFFPISNKLTSEAFVVSTKLK